MKITEWIKWKIAGKELTELNTLKIRLGLLEDWCGYDFPAVRDSARWAKDIHSYPYQCKGAHGDICDFREFLRASHTKARNDQKGDARPSAGVLLFKENGRGFARAEFSDLNGEKCSLQESSIVDDDAIWLGIDTPIPKRLVQNQGWQPIDIDPGDPRTLVAGRMHLNRQQVAALLPELVAFVETGHLYTERGQ